jgi:2-C-methyl-D-erythritol 4-phosphate cytidylyltransferase
MSTHTSPFERFYAVMPCAGFGSRAGTAVPKQYQSIAGLPMVVHTLRAFAGVSRITRGLVVIAPDDTHMADVLAHYPQPVFEAVPQGGATRADSVLAGLKHLLATGADVRDWVLVHDAARCLVTPAQINALIDTCSDDEVGGLLALKLADTLKAEAHLRVTKTVERADKWLAQTPQMFRLGTLVKALEQMGSQVTDESSAIEGLGLAPKLVAASSHNFKVTYPEDFALAEAILKTRA